MSYTKRKFSVQVYTIDYVLNENNEQLEKLTPIKLVRSDYTGFKVQDGKFYIRRMVRNDYEWALTFETGREYLVIITLVPAQRHMKPKHVLCKGLLTWYVPAIELDSTEDEFAEEELIFELRDIKTTDDLE